MCARIRRRGKAPAAAAFLLPPLGRGRLLWGAGCAGLAAALVVPFFLTQIPPVLDYPNHLARAFVLAFGQHDPWLSRMYEAHWRILPNLAVDLILPPLLQVLPLHVAGRLFLAASLLLPLLGVLLYSRVLFGRASMWSLGCALVAYNAGFLLGFVNFLLAVGAALLFASLWIGARERHPLAAFLGATCGAVVIFFCHIMGVVLLGLLIGAYELDRLWERAGAGEAVSARKLAGRAGAVLTVFIPTLVLFAFSPTAGMEGPTRWAFGAKPLFALAPVMNYSFWLDLATGYALVAFVALAMMKGWLVMPRSSGIALALLLLAFLMAPFEARGDAFFDVRFVLMAAYLLFAGLAENLRLRRGAASLAALCLLAVFVVRIGFLSRVWEEQNAEVGEMRAAVEPVPPGARVLVALVTPSDVPRYWRQAPRVRRVETLQMTNIHVATFLLARRRAFSPFLFSDPSVVPLAVRSPYRKLAMIKNSWDPPSYRLLGRKRRTARERRAYPFLDRWWSKYGYVLIVDAGGLRDPSRLDPERLRLVRFTDAAALYRVRRSRPSDRAPEPRAMRRTALAMDRSGLSRSPSGSRDFRRLPIARSFPR
jgi:hypothetical protein